MSWFWGRQGQDQSKIDAFQKLDSDLKDFLKKESPITNKVPSHSPTSTLAPTSAPSRITKPSTSEQEDTTPKKCPTLFQDGRYEHLWKTYQSPEEVEYHIKSDQEKIDEVLEGFKYRRNEIAKAALENCALEQAAVSDCWSSGGAVARLTLCRAESKALNRCHVMQSKFLKALGYLSSFDRPSEVDEQIQMHADSLYHRMLEQEQAMEAARSEGKPVPSFPPLLSQKPIVDWKPESEVIRKDVDDAHLQPSDLKESIRSKLKERLEGLTPAEREVEERAIQAEIRAGEQLSGNLTSIYEKQNEERRLRKERGKETLGDKVSSIFGISSR
ncbi:hypothetical protein BGHDH14_bgh04314 [Blumeria hordei DH14]|uniref:Autophagy protein n=1 Tax=Blumeria graminis f. sp. hordei (strain DH14) TaxID=546991 RepID=N1JJT7_BLUG1|nr:hypothetical protein BGHDH14_bgh04314 [Blumeria hordei DH14]